MSAYIRLGYKYHLHELYDQSLQLLKYHYTDDLQTWAKHNYWKPSHWEDELYSIGVVNIARLINEPTILPTALLACIYTPSDIVQGFEREDGTRETLEVEDLGRCFRAMKDIQQRGVDGIVRTFKGPVSATCKSSLVCPAMLTRAKLRHLEANVNGFRSGDPFCALDEIPGMPELETCADCTAMVKERHQIKRKALWNRLPTLLGVQVPGWGNLGPAPLLAPGDAPGPRQMVRALFS